MPDSFHCVGRHWITYHSHGQHGTNKRKQLFNGMSKLSQDIWSMSWPT